MPDQMRQSDEIPDYGIPWLKRWRFADFSWPALSSRPSWTPRQGGTVQDYLRRLDENMTDDELMSRGVLSDCGSDGLHHILFIPSEWAESGTVAFSPSDLLRAKQRYWEKLLTKGGIHEHFRGTISGVDLPADIEQQLVSRFSVSFEWVRFNRPVRNISRLGDRVFTQCAFDEDVIFYGKATPEGGQSTVHFTWCEFAKRIVVEQVSALGLLDINGSALRGMLDVSDSVLVKLRLDDCEATSFSMTDTTVSGPLTVGTTTIEWVEWINCTFDSHVLFVDAAIEKSLGWLACDFRSRVTLASMGWPASEYGCASASGSKFDGIVEIEGGEVPPPVQLFQEAEFRSKVSLNWFSDRLKRQSFEKELAAAASRTSDDFSKQKHAQDVESGCRSLRKVAEAAGDVHSEHLWHRAELIARKARGESAASEKGFSYLYGLLADYGLSIARPFTVLALSTICFGLLYAWLGGSRRAGPVEWHNVEEGFGYALNRTLPIGVFADEGNIWRENLLGSGGQIGRIVVRILATSQTIFSAILIYLGVMAVRRKFRIS